MTSRPRLRDPYRPQPGDNSVDVSSRKPPTGCELKEENMWMTASGAVGNHTLARSALWTTGTHPHDCGAVPRSYPRVIHPSSAVAPATMWLIHRIHRPYDDDETFREIDPLRVPGDEQLPINLVDAPSQNLRNSSQMLADRPPGTRVDPRLCSKRSRIAVSTHVRRRAGYR